MEIKPAIGQATRFLVFPLFTNSKRTNTRASRFTGLTHDTGPKIGEEAKHHFCDAAPACLHKTAQRC